MQDILRNYQKKQSGLLPKIKESSTVWPVSCKLVMFVLLYNNIDQDDYKYKEGKIKENIKMELKQQLKILHGYKQLIASYIVSQRPIITMFEQIRFEEVRLRLQAKEKQEFFPITLMLNQNGDVFVFQLLRKVRELIDFDELSLLCYYDSTKNAYFSFQQQDQSSLIPFSILVCDSLISLRYEIKITDQLVANPLLKQESSRPKRSPERHIAQVFEIVETWRNLYTKGSFNQKGEVEKMNLQKAAAVLGVPRKSLQDYHLLLRNGYNLGFNFKQNSRRKIGALRNFVKEKKKNKSEQIIQKEKLKNEQKYDEILLADIRKQIFGLSAQQYEEQLFRVVRNSSSDEDEIYDKMHEN